MKIQQVQTFPVASVAGSTTQGRNENSQNRNMNRFGAALRLVKTPADEEHSERSFEDLLRSEFQAKKLFVKPDATHVEEYTTGQMSVPGELDRQAIAHLHEFWA